MELTTEHIEAIKKAVLEVDYGKVILYITATAKTLDIEIYKNIRVYKEPTGSREAD